MQPNETAFRLVLGDLDDKSIFINWGKNERELVFRKLLDKTTLTAFAKKINHDYTTLGEIKNGGVKPSGHVYLSLYKILGLTARLGALKISS
ncbi:MAG: hypothetical protein NTW59_00515, partial [Candidatus Diapherotrites archaeon]|nr:hypothetical protein [Candidatus Diapherotrites archaeon]